jgi:ribosomal protein S18 acetylase RimI-like enzyme
MKYTLRPAIQEDIDWLDPFYESIMRPYVELTHEWNPDVFREKFNPANSQIIQLDGKDVGLFKHEFKEGALFLWDIQLEEPYRNQGIGSEIVRRLQTDAEEAELPVRLRVLKGNLAYRFYWRHGFYQVGELDNCFELEWNAANKSLGQG